MQSAQSTFVSKQLFHFILLVGVMSGQHLSASNDDKLYSYKEEKAFFKDTGIEKYDIVTLISIKDLSWDDKDINKALKNLETVKRELQNVSSGHDAPVKSPLQEEKNTKTMMATFSKFLTPEENQELARSRPKKSDDQLGISSQKKFYEHIKSYVTACLQQKEYDVAAYRWRQKRINSQRTTNGNVVVVGLRKDPGSWYLEVIRWLLDALHPHYTGVPPGTASLHHILILNKDHIRPFREQLSALTAAEKTALTTIQRLAPGNSHKNKAPYYLNLYLQMIEKKIKGHNMAVSNAFKDQKEPKTKCLFTGDLHPKIFILALSRQEAGSLKEMFWKGKPKKELYNMGAKHHHPLLDLGQKKIIVFLIMASVIIGTIGIFYWLLIQKKNDHKGATAADEKRANPRKRKSTPPKSGSEEAHRPAETSADSEEKAPDRRPTVERGKEEVKAKATTLSQPRSYTKGITLLFILLFIFLALILSRKKRAP